VWFHNAIGALVRDKINPAIHNWKDYLEEKKREMWEQYLMLNFRFLDGTHALVKHHALQMMGQSFRR
jgi:hypothetical protein